MSEFLPKKHTLEELTKYGELFDLHIKITKKIIDTIRKLHFECGTTIPDLRNKLKEELLELGWFKNGKVKKGISDLILKILGYEDWDSYAVNRIKIYKDHKLGILNKHDLKSVKGLLDYAKEIELYIEITPEIIEKIKKLHYEQGAGIQKITIELESELKPLGWMQENSVRLDIYTRTLKPRLKKNVSELIVFLLGYENYESYKKGQLKLHQKYKAKLRTDSGFNAKLKKEVKETCKGKCVICESIKQLEVHHIDSNFENNEKENLSLVCKKCHLKIRKKVIYYDYTNRRFIENTFYKIWKEKNTIKIKSFYDEKLIKIINSIDSFFRKWDAIEKCWNIDPLGFVLVQNKLLKYITSAGYKYEIPPWMVIIEDMSKVVPRCLTEVKGYCNHACDYEYGDLIKCEKAGCSDYMPVFDNLLNETEFFGENNV